MKWTKILGRVIQGVSVAAVVGSQLPQLGIPLNFGLGVPAQVVGWSSAAVAVISSVTQLLAAEKAQNTNPDGTPATQAYVPPPKG